MESMIFKKKGALTVFLIPAFLFMTVFLYYPFVMNIINSFQSIRRLGKQPEGWLDPWYENYQRLFTDKFMGVSLWNTLLMMILTVVLQVGIALILALLVDNIKKGAHFYRTVYFFPIVISATALGLMFNLVFMYQGGMVNTTLEALGMAPNAIPDWKDPDHALFTMFTPVVWQYIGYYFVIIVTGLSNISSDVYEAAEIDGADGFKRVGYITLPLLHNVLCTCLTLAITGSLKVFDLPWVMFPSGMPLDKTWMTGTYMYYTTFVKGDVDYGSTIAIAIVVLGVVISQLANAIFKEKDY